MMFGFKTKTKDRPLTEYEQAIIRVKEATKNLNRARINFSNATPEYFEAADLELKAAECKLDSALKVVKAIKDRESVQDRMIVTPQSVVTFTEYSDDNYTIIR